MAEYRKFDGAGNLRDSRRSRSGELLNTWGKPAVKERLLQHEYFTEVAAYENRFSDKIVMQ
jgi:hypothetical protein